VQQVKAIATSAIRSAANGQDFIDAGKPEQAGIQIELITGEQEAAYIYNGIQGQRLFRQ
jgi:exopolyphosphatase/guanosine-5'-triphosphate,3'-diphosphate pyrophosphatase